jgi:DNA-binding transcriptional MerR regulator
MNHNTSYEQWDKINKDGPNTLYKIGEMTKICDVTRKALLVYEEAGIISPIVKNKQSGFRYYTLEDVRKINILKTLQGLGLSLTEINDYFNDSSKIDIYIKRFETLRNQLDDRISELKQRKQNNKKSPASKIEFTVLPKQVFYAGKAQGDSFSEIADEFRRTFIQAVSTNESHVKNTDKPSIMSLLLERSLEGYTFLNLVSMDDDYDGPNRYVLEETAAVGLAFRGPYEELLTPLKQLEDYIKENHITVAGPLRLIWLEGPTALGNQPERFLTKMLYPIRKR